MSMAGVGTNRRYVCGGCRDERTACLWRVSGRKDVMSVAGVGMKGHDVLVLYVKCLVLALGVGVVV